MLEIDCRKCTNLTESRDGCKLYGNDVKKATDACRRDGFKNYHKNLTPGSTVWVIERDEDGTALDLSGYVLLACVAGAVITSAKVYGRDTLEDLMQYHADEYAEYENCDLAVFPELDCYTTKSDARAAFLQESEA